MVQIAELGGHRLFHLLEEARFFDIASQGTELSIEEETVAWTHFCKKNGMEPTGVNPAIPYIYSGCSLADLQVVAKREARISKWKQSTFDPLVEDYFDQHRGQMAKVVYSLLRAKEAGVARELWFRLHEGESTFAQLAPEHSSGVEKFTGGIIGPAMAGNLHPVLAEHLRGAHEGELLRPFQIGEWHLVARLEKRLAAVLDDQLRKGIIEELAKKQMEAHVKPT